MNIKQHVEHLDLQFGETHRGNCPVCNGKKTFTATSTANGIVYNCYKAGCNVGGMAGGQLTSAQLLEAMRLRKQQQESAPPTPISVPDGFTQRSDVPLHTKWLSTYGLDKDRLGTYYDVRQDRVCFPVRYKNVIVDFVGRSMKGRSPKWLRYANAHVPYTHGIGSVAVLVEDCVSAAVAGQVRNCVGFALLGTNILAEYLPMLQTYDTLVVALDPDARSKALSLVKDLRLQHANVYALNLRDDIKYRNETDMANLKTLGERYGTEHNQRTAP